MFFLVVMVALLAWNTAWLYSVTSPVEEDLTQGAAAVRAGDRDPRPVQAGGQGQRPAPPGEDARAREDMERMRRLMEQMKQEGG